MYIFVLFYNTNNYNINKINEQKFYIVKYMYHSFSNIINYYDEEKSGKKDFN